MTTLTFLATAALCLSLVAGDSVLRFRVEDTGVAQNCGSTPVRLTWSPKVLSEVSPVTITLNITFDHNYNDGTIFTTVTRYGDEEPFIKQTVSTPCDIMRKVMPCPAKKGTTINRQYLFEKTRILSYYQGRYTIVVKLINEKKEEMFCVKIDVVVKND